MKPISIKRSCVRAPLLAAPLFALLLVGCNRTEEAPAAPPAAAPASSAPGAPPPAAAAPPSSSSPSSSTTTAGTPAGAAATLPASDTATPSGATAVDAKETNPRGELTKQEESKSMPEALQGNNHSSPALDVQPAKP